MSLFDTIKFGRSRDPAEDKNSLTTLEKQAPQAYRTLQAIRKAYADAKLTHTFSGVSIISDKHNKGLFDQPELNTVAFVRPQSGIFTILYVPEYHQFAATNRQVNELRQWVNAHVYAGRFKFGRLYHNMTRPVLDVTFEYTYAYRELKAGQIYALAFGALDQIKSYRTMLPVVRLFADLRANIDSGGSPVSSDPSGRTVFSQFDNACRVTLSSTTQKHQHLGNALVGFLERSDTPYALTPDRKRLRLTLLGPALRSVNVLVYLTRHNHIVFEAHLPLTVEGAANRLYHSVYPAFVNDTISRGGSFQIDLEKNAAFYRYGVDLRGIEEMVDDVMLGSLLDEIKRIGPWLGGFRQVASGAAEIQVIQRLTGVPLPGMEQVVNDGVNNLEAAENYYNYLGPMFSGIHAGPRVGLKLPDAASSMLPVTGPVLEAAAETRPVNIPADSEPDLASIMPQYEHLPAAPATQDTVDDFVAQDLNAVAQSLGAPEGWDARAEPQHYAGQDAFWFENPGEKTITPETNWSDPGARPEPPVQADGLQQDESYNALFGQPETARQTPAHAYGVEEASFRPEQQPQPAPRPRPVAAQRVSVGISPMQVLMVVLIGLLLVTQVWMGFTLARLNNRVARLESTVAGYQESMTVMQGMMLETLVRMELLEYGQ